MPKTLTGAELQLDDAPARDSELFLVDGNNLAYRAFFALPEELATSDGFSTNALLGFTNMLFKLLSDYKPKGVAVAWDTHAVHRAAISEDYKSRTSARSSRPSATATSSSRVGRRTTSSPPLRPRPIRRESRRRSSPRIETPSSSSPTTWR
jgi:5'-3' exonuclease